MQTPTKDFVYALSRTVPIGAGEPAPAGPDVAPVPLAPPWWNLHTAEEDKVAEVYDCLVVLANAALSVEIGVWNAAAGAAIVPTPLAVVAVTANQPLIVPFIFEGARIYVRSLAATAAPVLLQVTPKQANTVNGGAPLAVAITSPIGQQAMATSVSVAIASDQTPLPDAIATGTLTTAAGAGSTVVLSSLASRALVGVKVTGNTTIDAVFEASRDGTNWESVTAFVPVLFTPVIGFAAGVNGSWIIPVHGYRQLRVRCTAIGLAPTATVTLEASTAPASFTPLLSALGHQYVLQTVPPPPPANYQATGAITTAAPGAGNTVEVPTGGCSVVSVEATANTTVDTVIEGRYGNGGWYAVYGYDRLTGALMTGFASGVNGVCQVPCAGLTAVRVRGTAVGALPTVTIKLEAGAGAIEATRFNRVSGYEQPTNTLPARVMYDVAPMIPDPNYSTRRGDGSAVRASDTTITLTSSYTLTASQINQILIDDGSLVRRLEPGKNGVRCTLSAAPGPYTLTIIGAGTAPVPVGSVVEVSWVGPDKAISLEDAAHVGGETLVRTGRVRRDTMASSGGDNDWVTPNQDPDGFDPMVSKSRDAPSNAERTLRVNSDRGAYEGPVPLIAAAQTITNGWVDVGPEYPLQGTNTVKYYVLVTKGDGDVSTVQFRLMTKTANAGAGEYPIPVKSVIVGTVPFVVSEDDEVINPFVTNATAYRVLEWHHDNAVPWGQLQVKATTPGTTMVLTSCEVVKGWR